MIQCFWILLMRDKPPYHLVAWNNHSVFMVTGSVGQGIVEMSGVSAGKTWKARLSWECWLDTYLWPLRWLDSERDHLEMELWRVSAVRGPGGSKETSLSNLAFRVRQLLTSILPGNGQGQCWVKRRGWRRHLLLANSPESIFGKCNLPQLAIRWC